VTPCRLCHSTDTGPLPFAVPPEAGGWVRCRACGSDTGTRTYADVAARYHDRAYYDTQPHYTDIDYLKADCRSNCEWFGHHHRVGMEKTFLDVGCWHGAALMVMQELGYAIHGYDVSPPPYMGPHVTCAPFFCEWFFPKRYACVLAREVWEHVPDPERFLHALHAVALPGGLVQVQTPRAVDGYNSIGYQSQHLHLASEPQFRRLLDAAMLDVLDFRIWAEGMAALCRARE
jgi:2-polyprenyl-3-methyl-5-hydroxy-6-metoxy-1,4-benzoquinol methylase